MWLVVVGVILLGTAFGLFCIAVVGRDRRSADERLAEIEAARAIPDSENAAILYSRLLQDPNAASVLDNPPDSLVKEVYSRTLYESWLSADHPELIAWVKGHQSIIDRLLCISQFEQCRFSISIDISNMSQMERVLPMRRWAFLLSSAAHNDIGEGRSDAAITKWRCLIQTGNHLCQQPDLTNHLLAHHMCQLSLEPMARFIVTGSPTEVQLQKIEAMPLPMEDRWAEYEREICLIDALILKKITEGLGPLDYLRYRLTSYRMNRIISSAMGDESPLDRAGPLYRRHIAVVRGIRILVALRRYRNVNDRWPGSLDEIRSSLPDAALADPVNKGPFVYRLMADTFKLYSKGENNIDENGEWTSKTGDDWPIWPLREKPFGVSEGQAQPR